MYLQALTVSGEKLVPSVIYFAVEGVQAIS